MTSELLLARRLIEAVVDPDASQSAAEEAAAELAEVSARLGVSPGRALTIGTFEGMRAQDLSPAAWLYLLERESQGEPELPEEILETLFLEYSDPVIRFRLVSGALAQPATRQRYLKAIEWQPAPESIAELPASWPKQRIASLEARSATPPEVESAEVQTALAEFVLYLLQDGSQPALALAAGAVAPDQHWRRPAWELARGLILSIDSNLRGYGSAFRNARIRE